MKKIIITEEQEKELARILNEEQDVQQMPVSKKSNKPYIVDPEKMLIAKKKLDKCIVPRMFSTVAGGKPCSINIGIMVDGYGNELKKMYKEDVVDYLADELKDMFLDHDERQAFCNLAVDKWFNNKIGPHGMVDVNQYY